MKIRLGYACINTQLGDDVCTNRRVNRKTLIKLGEDQIEQYLQKLSLSNVADVLKTITWNEEHDIRFFRITSNLFPHVGDTEMIRLFPKIGYFRGDIKFARESLSKIGAFAREHDHRLTMHSNPYVQLGTPNIDVLDKSMFDIIIHYKIFRYMNFTPSSYNCLILHGGGIYGNKFETLERIKTVLSTMNPKIKNMLVFENDERHYNPLDLLLLCEEAKLPLCFDIFHNSISKERVEITPEFIDRILATWHTTQRFDVFNEAIPMTPKFHISEQDDDKRFGAHGAYVYKLPDWLFKLNIEKLDIMLESKMKEKSVLLLYDKYPQLKNK